MMYELVDLMVVNQENIWIGIAAAMTVALVLMIHARRVIRNKKYLLVEVELPDGYTKDAPMNVVVGQSHWAREARIL